VINSDVANEGNPTDLRVVIIGAGIGGLCLAQGLRRAGIDVAIFERDAAVDARRQGYRISLKDTGAQALRDCLPAHLFDLCVATRILSATRMIFMDTALTPKFDKPIPATEPARDGFGVNRLTLREILLTGLDGAVHYGRTFERYEEAGGRVRVHFADGGSVEADLLVGADGTGSAVRAQLVPDAVIDELHWAIYGRTPITGTTLTWLPDQLLDTFNRVLGDGDAAFAVATCRTGEPVARAVERLAPDARLTDVPPYLQWITPLADPAQADAEPARLDAIAAEMVRGWHPAVGRIIAEADVDATFAVRVTSARPVTPWRAPNVTLLGDAVHTMSPGRGDGANIALKDAAILCRAVIEAAEGRFPLPVTKGVYEELMLEYGFAAVEQSKSHPFAPRR
jgi:2-polyprenyl-6-methoxyphenol hydroxylase-like FAD-dependent oxidoreductase